VKNPPTTTSQIPVLAPVAGEVVERFVGPGQLLQAGATQVFTISDMSTVWVLVNVYQGEMAYVRLGDRVDVSTDAYPEIFHGRISYLATALDPNTRTLQARIVTENPGRKLKKDMYVTASVNAGAIANALTVPDASVLRDSENQPFVYVQSTAKQNEFARRLVQLGASQGGRTQVTMVMVQYIFESAFVKNDGGYAATVAVAMFVVVIAFSVLNFQALRAGGSR